MPGRWAGCHSVGGGGRTASPAMLDRLQHIDFELVAFLCVKDLVNPQACGTSEVGREGLGEVAQSTNGCCVVRALWHGKPPDGGNGDESGPH